jgi:hypothetical protein
MTTYCYYYDENYFYTSIGEAFLCPITKSEYLLAPNSTLEPIPELDNEGNKVDLNTQQIKWDDEQKKWSVVDIILQGNFYDISNGSSVSEIAAKNINQYTYTKPNIIQNEGDVISFNIKTQKWFYFVKGDITIKKEQDLLLQETKENKQKEVIEFYFNLRFFNVINGHIAKFIAAEADYINTQGKLHYGYNTISSNIIGLEDQAERLGINKSTLFYNYVDSIATYTQVPYLKLIEIREKIAEQRSKCAVLRDMHNAIISQLPNIEMIEQYNYKLDIRPFLDDKTKVATSIQDIIINSK